MVDRWVLERAGITNVYQYGEETLHFGGGRLLLRGVNGSGKSTAMNMLLPFLLEADTRRIDAAGEQSGVLRSWMLSGRDEQQPQGYLWVEFANGDDHLTIGCGIRANRSTDRVTTWWFVTARRPGIDLALVEGRQPLSADALRAVLEPNAVYSQDQRAAYRNQVRSRLYGGSDLDQHLRLLHVVRNPRVGDRIDVDLPRYLEDALPQLSDDALDDAAQPLEDLEEHRRNVEDLTRTANALQAIEAVYRTYARSELHRRADSALEVVAARGRLVRVEAEATDAHRLALEALDGAQVATRGLEADERRLDGEIRDLEASDAYKAGAELNDLRAHVGSLTGQVAMATDEVERRTTRARAALAAVTIASGEADQEATSTRARLADLADLARRAGLSARPPDAPRTDVRRIGADGPDVPSTPLEVDSMLARVGAVRSAAQLRTLDVAEVGAALLAVDAAEAELRRAEEREAEAGEGVEQAEGAFGEARRRLQDRVDWWRTALGEWGGRLAAHRADHDLPELTFSVDPDHEADLAGRHEAITTGWLDIAQQTVDHHGRGRAELAARRAAQDQEIDELRQGLAVLRARELPEPPATAWQRADRAACLADLVDFTVGVPAEERTGLEAAMVAAGLLGAEVDGDGSLTMTDGDLLVRPGPPVPRPLSSLLTVTVPNHLLEEVRADAVARVLASISVDPADLDQADDRTVVTVDGRFRTGLLRGRHRVEVAEHIGTTARRASLERQRAEAAAALQTAEAERDESDRLLVIAEEAARDASDIRQDLPPTRQLVLAATRSELAEESLDEARQRLADRRSQHLEAERAHARALDTSRRTAASLGLPHDQPALDEVASTLSSVAGACDLTDQAMRSLAGAVARWSTRGQEWEGAVDDHAASQRGLDELRDQFDLQSSRLATLEDSVGLDYQEVVKAVDTSRGDLAATRQNLVTARQRSESATGEVASTDVTHRRAVADRAEADDRCVAALPGLRAALNVPGLLAAAIGETEARPEPEAVEVDRSAETPEPAAAPPPVLPVVAESPDGVRKLAGAIRSLVAAPEGASTGAESIRQSLRQRRDALGAGWDAEDHQPDERLPLHVEVTGPLGRMALPDASEKVRVQLQQMASLLSAKQDQALRNLLQGLVAREVAEKLHAAGELVKRMNRRLDTITTSQGIGVSLRWRRREDLDAELGGTVELLAKPPDLRTADEDQALTSALSQRIADARREDPEQPYRELIADVLDYRKWHRMALILRRPGRSAEQLTRRTALSEGEKKMVSYLPLFAAVAASCDALAESAPDAPRFVLLDDAFAKVSEDNHAKLFGLLVELDLDFIATSERLWGTHASVPELAITEVIRDADLGAIVLEHSRWNGHRREQS